MKTGQVFLHDEIHLLDHEGCTYCTGKQARFSRLHMPQQVTCAACIEGARPAAEAHEWRVIIDANARPWWKDSHQDQIKFELHEALLDFANGGPLPTVQVEIAGWRVYKQAKGARTLRAFGRLHKNYDALRRGGFLEVSFRCILSSA